jgi:hypothetical protein
MTHFTSQLPESVDHVDPVEISPRYSIVRALGYLVAWESVLSVCALPFGYLTLSHGSWNSGPAVFNFQPVLIGLFMTVGLAVSALGIAAGVASGAGKPWSRKGMLLWADLSIVLAVIGILPFYLFIVRSGQMDIGLAHGMELLIALKFWIVELPLSIAVLYWFNRPNIVDAYGHPEQLAPDKSQR